MIPNTIEQTTNMTVIRFVRKYTWKASYIQGYNWNMRRKESKNLWKLWAFVKKVFVTSLENY